MGIFIRKVSMRHRSGTKEYHLLLVKNSANGRGILVNRWGKAGAWGQMKTEKNTEANSANSFTSKVNEKEARGYNIYADKIEEAANVEEAKSIIGMTYWPQLGAANLEHVFPGVDTYGVREAKPAAWKETQDGKWERDDKPEHSMPSKEDEVAEAKTNPNWGLF